MECIICKKSLKNFRGLSKHIFNSHKDINIKSYYDTYIKKPNEGLCKTCNAPTTYRGVVGYLTHCSSACVNLDPDIRNQRSLYQTGKIQTSSTIEKRVSNTDQNIKESNRINSMLKLYNVSNPSQMKNHQEKYIKTSQLHYGTNHPFQCKDVLLSRNSFRRKYSIFENISFTTQGYEHLFLEQLSSLYPDIKYEDLNEYRTLKIKMDNGKIHWPDFYSKKHNHIFEIKSEWTYNINKELVLYKMSDAKSKGFDYTLIIYKNERSIPTIL